MNKYEKATHIICSMGLLAFFFSTGNAGGVGMRAAMSVWLYWFGLVDSESLNSFVMGTWLPWY